MYFALKTHTKSHKSGIFDFFELGNRMHMASTGPRQVANIFWVCGAQENFILAIIKLSNVTKTCILL